MALRDLMAWPIGSASVPAYSRHPNKSVGSLKVKNCMCLRVCVCVLKPPCITAWSSMKYLSGSHWPDLWEGHIIRWPLEGPQGRFFKCQLLASVSGTDFNLNEESLLSFVLDRSTRLSEAVRTPKNQMALQERVWMFGSESLVCGSPYKIAIWVTGSRLSPAFQTAHLCL